MKVNLEIRDTDELKKRIREIFCPFILWSLLTMGGLILGVKLLDWAIIVFFIGVISFVPLTIWMLIKANKVYKETWTTKEFDFDIVDNQLYLNSQKLHVNYNKSLREIYVHDLGEHENPYKATFYGISKESDTDVFLTLLKDNNIKIEKESYQRINRKNGSLAQLGISRYRR